MQTNIIIIAGRLTKAVNYGATKNGTPRSWFILANNQGKHTNYCNIVAFGKRADYAHKYLHKAQRVTVQGRYSQHSTKSDGDYKNYVSIIADSFDAIHPKRKQPKDVKNLYSKYDELDKKLSKISKENKKDNSDH